MKQIKVFCLHFPNGRHTVEQSLECQFLLQKTKLSSEEWKNCSYPDLRLLFHLPMTFIIIPDFFPCRVGRKEFSNDPTEAMAEISGIFQKNTSLIQADIGLIKRFTDDNNQSVSRFQFYFIKVIH